jgi:hypothetical protein
MMVMPEFLDEDVDVSEEILHETVEHGENEAPESEQIEEIIAIADNMTASAIEEAAEEVGADLNQISLGAVRDAFETMEEPETEETSESEEEEDTDEEVTEEAEGTDETDSDADYDDIVSGTIGDAKDELEDLANPDWDAALEAEEENKNRTTFIDWLETRVEQ